MSDKEVYEQSMATYAAAITEEQAAFQRARASGDIAEQVRASQMIASVRAQANEYQKLAEEHARSVNPQPQSHGYSDQMSKADAALAAKYGLPEKEYEVGVNWTDSIPDKETRLKTYIENQKRYRQMRADGTYRDDQGRVTR